MNAAELDTLLRQFLVDHKLNPNERKVLEAWVKKNITNEHQRAVARSRVFAEARQAVGDPQSVQVVQFLEDVLKVLVPMTPLEQSTEADAAFFSPGLACLQRINARIRNALNAVDICVFTITDDRITDEIIAAHNRGVQVRILTDNDKTEDRGSDIAKFRQAGIPVRIDESPFHMHHKFAIIDQQRLLNGSYNWTRSAADSNEENLVDCGEPELLARFQKEFDDLWARFA